MLEHILRKIEIVKKRFQQAKPRKKILEILLLNIPGIVELTYGACEVISGGKNDAWTYPKKKRNNNKRLKSTSKTKKKNILEILILNIPGIVELTCGACEVISGGKNDIWTYPKKKR